MDPGVIEIELKSAWPIVNEVEVDMVPETAEMVQVPSPELVATPYVPTEFPITATFTSEELQFTMEVTSCVLPSV